MPKGNRPVTHCSTPVQAIRAGRAELCVRAGGSVVDSNGIVAAVVGATRLAVAGFVVAVGTT